jgi:GT2 family glycosyltransferase
MNVSYLIITYNRRAGLLANLRSVFAGDSTSDVWIVDNASTDGTADAVRKEFPRVRLIVLDRNLGMPARNVALQQMTSEYVVLLDDDSYPVADAVTWSTAYMDVHRDVAAVVGRAELPDGRSEASAFPTVMLGCATCVRLRALRDVGFFPHDFFRQAEEYDLSFRLWNAGHRIERFEDLRYRHDKKPSVSRASREVAGLDLKHNLILTARYLPDTMLQSYWDDFVWRYGAILKQGGFAEDTERIIAEAETLKNGPDLRRQVLREAVFESIFEHRKQRRSVSQFAAQCHGRRIAIADASKNLFATHRACKRTGLDIVAILDDRPAFTGLNYRGIPVVTRRDFDASSVDGVILSNTNPAQVDAAYKTLVETMDVPVLRLWTPRVLNDAVLADRLAAAA